MGTLDGLFWTAKSGGGPCAKSGGSPCATRDASKMQEAGPPCCELGDQGEVLETGHNIECSGEEEPTCTHDNALKQQRGGVAMLECPVCGGAVATDNRALNCHIDECLNVSAIHSLQKTEAGQPDAVHCVPTWKKAQGKRTVKRRSCEQACTPVKKPTVSHTLDHLWNVT